MQKALRLDGIDQEVIFARRKGVRSIKIVMKSDGRVRVSVPYGVPEIIAKKFVMSHAAWIAEHSVAAVTLREGMRIGKNHTLHFVESDTDKHRTRVTDTEIIVKVPATDSSTSAKSTAVALKACEKALHKQAQRLLPQRLEYMSGKVGINYKSVHVKKMTSRWGACDQSNNITLNIYMMQLEWELIDYVLIHELSHTVHHHHQASFWELVAAHCPNYKDLRKTLKTKKTAIAG